MLQHNSKCFAEINRSYELLKQTVHNTF